MAARLRYKIVPSTNWYLIKKMGVEAGLEDGELGEVVQAWEARVDKRTIGGIMLLRSGLDCTIEWLSVLPGYRDKGIGTALTKEAIKEAKKRKLEKAVISMQTPEFFRRLGFVYSKMEELSKDFSCYRCKRYNKSCFPVAMVLDLTRPLTGIEIEEVRDIPLLERLARDFGQEADRQITRRIVKGWFALKDKKIIGGIGIFKWRGDYTLEYSFASEDNKLVQENLIKNVLLFCQKKGIKKVYYIRGAPDHLFPIERFGFKEIHWRDLPPLYRDFSLQMCDKCPKETKKVCNPIAMVLELGRPPRYVLVK